MRRLLRSSDWPTHVAAAALVLLLIAPAIDDGGAPAIIAAGAALAVMSLFGFWSATHHTSRRAH